MNTERKHLKQRRNGGFTLPEVILIVAALAIVSAMAMPDIAYFFGRQTVEQEKLVLSNIQKALDSYAKECNRLPEPTGNPTRSDCKDENPATPLAWHEALAAFSNMSAQGIQKDVWGNERRYTLGEDVRNYRQGLVTFYYATVRSVGQNRCDDSQSTPPCPLGDNTDYDPDWSDLNGYESFAAQDDDLLVKYTDSQWKVAAQDETVQRIERIIDALDRYAQARFNEEVHADMDCISEKIFYPPSRIQEDYAHSNINHPQDGSAPGEADCRSIGGTGGVQIGFEGASFIGRYGEAVTTDVARITGDTFVNTEVADRDTRLTEMEQLMRVLGLPEDHCCSAITGDPFYYYSNPEVSGNFAVMPPYFPPQVRVDPLP